MPKKKSKLKKEFKEFQVNPNLRGVSKTSSRKKAPSFKAMKSYIEKNLPTTVAKLKRMEKSGLYKASPVAQNAKSQLRMLYRKMGLSDENYHYGKSFKNSLTSAADVRVLYNIITDVRAIDARAVRKEYERLKGVYSEMGTDFDTTFTSLSSLSSEFHEMFAILTYNTIQEMFYSEDMYETKDGNKNISTTKLMDKMLQEVADKQLSDKQAEYLIRAYNKMSSQLDSKTLRNFEANHLETINEYIRGLPKNYKSGKALDNWRRGNSGSRGNSNRGRKKGRK
ncbi:unnamed protein product [Cylicostephanus goldi]|uniref:Uncharacterized protein n=1 Tax=Cylicostephanus goldi TaxID=71465 RepID=A0A3P6PKB2_CYLGO|nr:unnamed protein product [Cylicostephanus goldi]